MGVEILSEGTERICAHNIEWWVRGPRALKLEDDEQSMRHIQKLLTENCVQGELCMTDGVSDATFYGWWEIGDRY